MNTASIIIAASAAFIWGGVWYGINGARWAAALGSTKEEFQKNKNPVPYILAGIFAILTAGMMRHIFYMAGISSIQEGIISGLGLGAFIATPWILMHYSFAGRPKSLWWIDGIHTVVGLGIIGGILAAFN